MSPIATKLSQKFLCDIALMKSAMHIHLWNNIVKEDMIYKSKIITRNISLTIKNLNWKKCLLLTLKCFNENFHYKYYSGEMYCARFMNTNYLFQQLPAHSSYFNPWNVSSLHSFHHPLIPYIFFRFVQATTRTKMQCVN